MNSIKVIFSSIENIIPSSPQVDINDEKLEQIHEKVGSLELKNDHYDDNSNNNNNDDDEKYEVNEDIKNHQLHEVQHQSLHGVQWSVYSLLKALLKMIFFIPNLVIMQPLIMFWNILMYPVNYITNSIIITPMNEFNPHEKTQLIRHENIISNNIKSPTSSSKYIIPPPQRLFPLTRNPNKHKKRKVLILDLDETLIHSLSKGSPRSLNTGSNNSNLIEIKLNNIATLYHVHKRPYCDFFLKEISKWFELQIFTASVKEYANPIIDWLEGDNMMDEKLFTKRYYRDDCTYRNGVGYIKDLSRFFPNGEDLRNVVILDNSPISYALHEDNAVMIEGWINDQNDKDLINLLPMLHSLSFCIDVRFILGLRQGEKVLEY